MNKRKPRARIVKVVQVGAERFSTVKPAVRAIAWLMTMKQWDKHRDKYWKSGENYEAMTRLSEKAARRITPIIKKALS